MRHLVLDRVSRRQNQNRQRRLRPSDESQDFGAAQLRQHQIQQQQIVCLGVEVLDASEPIGGNVGDVALCPQAAA